LYWHARAAARAGAGVHARASTPRGAISVLRMVAPAVVALATCWTTARGATVEEIVRLPSEGDAVLPVLFSRDDTQTPGAVALLFTGGAGSVGLLARGIPHPGGNFLVRSRQLFLDQGIATAVIDAPSDVASMSDGYRMSARHVRDVAAVVADARSRWPRAKIFLVGTSRGTVSAAYAGAALGPAVAGVVLSSSVLRSSRGGAGLAGFDDRSIRTPLLLVHHVDDACPVTPYAAAQALSSRYPLISVHGGDPPRSDACEPFSAHGYVGVEAATVSAISHWMLGLDYPRQVP